MTFILVSIYVHARTAHDQIHDGMMFFFVWNTSGSNLQAPAKSGILKVHTSPHDV